jgi:hypothetical protein
VWARAQVDQWPVDPRDAQAQPAAQKEILRRAEW